MKYIKMLGLAAVAAAALTAFLGAGTASATVLCETNATSNCGAAWHVNGNTNLVFSAETSIALRGPLGIIISTCTASTVEGLTTTGSSGTTVSGNITKLTFENCNRATTVSSSTTGSLEVHHLAGTDNGTVTSSDTTVLIHEVPSPFPSTCAYLTNATDIGTLTGKDHPGNLTLGTPTFDIAATIPTETSGCPNGTWEGKYKYTGITPFNVSAS
jgi:hypothetical protein